MLAAALLLLSGCADDSEQPSQNSGLQLLSATRAGDDPVALTDDGSSFMMYLATPNGTPQSVVFTYTGGQWNSGSNVSVREETQYYIYGYMPNDADVIASIAPLTGNYANGATLTLRGLPLITDEDIGIVVGVKRATSKDDKSVATEGEYGYFSGVSGENYVNLLMDHLYTRLRIYFCVDDNYATLRKICLKSVTLKSTYGETVDATVTISDGSGLSAAKVSYSGASASPVEKSAVLYSNDEVEYLKVEPEVTDRGKDVYCPHCLFDGNGTYVSITSTYDVYDKNGNLIRKDCTATNSLKMTDMAPGVYKQLTMTVTPTYLYILSDPDLDNPTIELRD